MVRVATYSFGFSVLVCTAFWGFSGHKLITEKAVHALPESKFKDFAMAHRDFLVQHSIDPDERRSVDPSEGPQHYIDLELFGIHDAKSPLLQTGFDEPKSASEKPRGRLPWRIEDLYARLVIEMRTGGWEQTRLTMAELAHYLEDATVPLHVTENYDGQLTNQEGAHARFEEELIELQWTALSGSLKSDLPAKTLDAAGRKAAIWETIRTGYVELPTLLRADKEVIMQMPEENWAAELWKRNGALVQKRLAHAVWLVASFWQSAWEEAGRPDPVFLPSGAVQPKDKIFSTADAKAHIGEEITVEFVVAKVGYSKKSRTIYINSNDPHEGHFTAVVFAANREKIEEALKVDLRDDLKGKKIRVRGKVQKYKDSPEIILAKPEQVEIVKD